MSLVPYEEIPKLSSRDLVNEFLRNDEPAMKVEIEKTGRSPDSVYTSLLVYLKRHVEIDVSVKLVEGDIILFRGKDEE